MHTCAHCGSSFEASRTRKYCTPRCKNNAGAILRRARNLARTERRCYRCKRVKPVDEFGSPTKTYCKPCSNAYQRTHAAALPAEQRQARRRRSYESESPERRNARARLRRWGLTPGQLERLLADQGGRCAICPATEPGGRGAWHVDHDHNCCPAGRSCGRCIRGLLCTRCNVGLGNFRDDPNLLAAAAAYLRK